ncbi:hypothetical protein BGZ47_000500 [Haplosporangium gracile]|nr:hypothetical protein BGZ47_000500 [Haplosporangium gracile]
MPMSSSIPNYPQACLTADNAISAVYLIDVPVTSAGGLEVNYVGDANINSSTTSALGYRVSPEAWDSGAPKTCFSYLSDTQAIM